MAWQDNLRKASFRGVEFFVKSHETRGGQRVQVTEFPGRDQANTQTFGKKNRSYTFDAYVIGDDYDIQRNKLIIALEKVGTGKLVHPFLGNFNVLIPDYSWREGSNELNLARFSISIIDSSDLLAPVTVLNTKGAVATAKAESLKTQRADFVDKYSIIDKAITIAKATEKGLDKAIDLIQNAKGTVSGNFLYSRNLELIKLKVVALVRNAGELFDSLSDLIGFGTNADDDQPATPENANGSYQDLKALAEFEADEIITEDPDDPTLLMQESIKLISLTNQSAVLSFIDFKSADEAEKIRTEIFLKLDQFIESTENDDVYNALYDLRTGVTADIDDRIRTLPRLIPFIPIVTLPALVIAHELYGNIDREQEIIDRNIIEHPGFVPGQVELEVLLNDT